MFKKRIRDVLSILGDFFTRYSHIQKAAEFKKIYSFNLIYFFNDKLSREISIKGIFEKEQLFATLSVLKKKRTLIDVGANIGNHSIFFSKYFKKILSFEPFPLTFSVLKLNTMNIKNISLFNYGLSDKTKILYFDDKATCNVAGMKLLRKSKISTKLNTFDKKFSNLKDIYLIKVDVEGHEKQVISGMTKTLKKNSSVLFIEFDPNDYYKSSLINKLKKIGYINFYFFSNSNDENKIKLKNLPWIILRTLLFGRKKGKIKITSFEEYNSVKNVMRDNILCSKNKLNLNV